MSRSKTKATSELTPGAHPLEDPAVALSKTIDFRKIQPPTTTGRLLHAVALFAAENATAAENPSDQEARTRVRSHLQRIRELVDEKLAELANE